ncbi:unnamed protein product [Linum trigynum]|uniref:Uncharacterized protein n=1 Tax=Linum trigynum TaxID=586398 RepID=A0AAV2FYA4_9ROSI
MFTIFSYNNQTLDNLRHKQLTAQRQDKDVVVVPPASVSEASPPRNSGNGGRCLPLRPQRRSLTPARPRYVKLRRHRSLETAGRGWWVVMAFFKCTKREIGSGCYIW